MTPTLSYAAVADRIRRAILLGTYIPGDRLPPERALAEQIGVARATLREALRVLEGEGYVASRRGAAGGCIVLERPAPDAREALRGRMDEFDHLLDFRLANECAAARLAARRRTEDDLLALGAVLDGMRRHTSMALFRRADTAFHLGIADAARNPLIRRAVEEGRVAMYLPLDALDFEVMLASALEGHRKILAAIAAANGGAAERAAAAHIEDTRRELHLVTTVAADRVV